MKFSVFQVSRRGGRECNEDRMGYCYTREAGLFLLADGMGGYNAGEIASAMAVTFVRAELSRWLEEAATVANTRDVRRAMEICVDNANRSIFDAAHTHEAYAGNQVNRQRAGHFTGVVTPHAIGPHHEAARGVDHHRVIIVGAVAPAIRPGAVLGIHAPTSRRQAAPPI